MITKEVGIRFEVTSDENWYYGQIYLGDICFYTRLEDVRGRINSEQHLLQEMMMDLAASMRPQDPNYDD